MDYPLTVRHRDGRILDYGTGLSRKSVIAGIKGLADKGIINVEKREDKRGESQVNIYTLRFREGVVTQGNYRSNRNTLPPVTHGNPQDSVLQEPVLQQQLPVPRADSTVTDERTDVVVSNAPDMGRPDLYEGLRDLGVHHLTAARLLRQFAHDEIELLLDFVSQRLQSGWTPQESAAAWLVSAIRNHYQPPAHRGGQQQHTAAPIDQAKTLPAVDVMALLDDVQDDQTVVVLAQSLLGEFLDGLGSLLEG